MRFSVKSVSTGKLYFAIWFGSIQSPYDLADRFKIHPIVRFDTWNIGVHHATPTLYPADAPWSQLSKKRIISDQSLALFEKIAAACDEPARNWDFGQKIGIFHSNPLHRALKQNRPQTGKNVDFSDHTRFLKIFCVQHVALTVRRPKHPSLVWCTGIFLCETFSRRVPRDSNWGHHMADLFSS